VSTARYIARGLGRGAARMRAAAEGITLVELLVVLTILGLMAAIVIPTFARFGFFSRNETQLGARELYKVLSATRVLAATNRVDTAVAYAVTSKRQDSLTGEYPKSIESYAVVQNVPEGYKLLGVDGNEVTDKSTRALAFVPVEGMQEAATFRPMPQGTALLAQDAYGDGENPLRGSLKGIHIYLGEYEYDPSQRYWLFRASEELTQADGTYDFPAHVFTPSGRMEWSNSDKERREINVGYPPDADPVERFASPDSVDPQNVRLSDFRTIKLELYRGTGRVQIVREES